MTNRKRGNHEVAALPRNASDAAGVFLFALRFIAALIMGVAVCGMHYTGMAAASFTPSNEVFMVSGVDSWLLGFSVAVSTFVVLFTALMSSVVSHNFGSSIAFDNAGD